MASFTWTYTRKTVTSNSLWCLVWQENRWNWATAMVRIAFSDFPRTCIQGAYANSRVTELQNHVALDLFLLSIVMCVCRQTQHSAHALFFFCCAFIASMTSFGHCAIIILQIWMRRGVTARRSVHAQHAWLRDCSSARVAEKVARHRSLWFRIRMCVYASIWLEFLFPVRDYAPHLHVWFFSFIIICVKWALIRTGSKTLKSRPTISSRDRDAALRWTRTRARRDHVGYVALHPSHVVALAWCANSPHEQTSPAIVNSNIPKVETTDHHCCVYMPKVNIEPDWRSHAQSPCAKKIQ